MRQALENQWVKLGTGLIFGVIILAFVLFFGPQTGGLSPSEASWVARVGGTQINNTEMAAAFERYRRLSNNSVRLEESEFADIQRQQVYAVAGVELLADRAREAGLAVSSDELRCFIVNWHRGYAVNGERICTRFPVDYAERFRNYDIIWFTEADGTFTQYYDQSVRNRFNLASEEYERRKENELLARYYLAALTEAVEVSPTQVANTWNRRNTTVDLEVIKLDPATVSPVDPSDAEIAAWAAGHAAEIQAEYDANTDAYAVEREVNIRRIYIRRPTEDSPDLADAQARYEAALARVTTGGEDFEAVARELSEIEREAEEGGDMGPRTADTISSDIWDATTSMSAGDVQGVEQQYAWNVIKLESVEEARTRPLDEVRNEIAGALYRAELTEEAAEALAERGTRVLEIAAAGGTLLEAAQQEAEERTQARRDAALANWDATSGEPEPEVSATAPLPVTDTEPFAMDRPSAFLAMGGTLPPGIEFPPDPADSVPGVGSSRELVSIAFGLTADAPLHNGLVDVEGVQVLVRLNERVEAPAEMPAEEAAAIRNELRQSLVSSIIGDENQQAALVMGMPGELPSLVMQLVEEALSNGDIKLRASYFEVAAADPVEEI